MGTLCHKLGLPLRSLPRSCLRPFVLDLLLPGSAFGKHPAALSPPAAAVRRWALAAAAALVSLAVSVSLENFPLGS